jgi:Rac GTPase-activating protein 1
VAECRETKMPIANIAKVFGPTIVGYSSLDPDQHKMLTETYIQALVIENLLNIQTNYWSQFVNVETPRDETIQQNFADSTKYYMGKCGKIKYVQHIKSH